MRQKLIYLAAVALLATTCHASFDFRTLIRRQSGEAEQENTTPKSNTEASQQQPPKAAEPNGGTQPQGRLYPDLPGHRPGVNFLPPFNAPPQHNGAMPPFVPFNMPNRQLNSDQQAGPFGPRMLPPPRPMTPAERIQSQSFSNGLGKRLLSLIGVDAGQQNETTNAGNGAPQQPSPPVALGPMQALQNSTVLNEMNKRLNMLMGGISKMYNSTVQQQLGLLQERFKKESANSTNQWQQRMAQQVPMFFEQMAARVSNAQEQMNRVLREVAQAAQGNTSVFTQSPRDSNRPSFFGAIDRFMHPSSDGAPFNSNGGGGGGDFVDQISRSFGMGPEQRMDNANGSRQQPVDLGERMREFWQVQVQPQIGIVRNQMARVWRDLTTSGALTPETVARSRMQALGNANSNSNNKSDNQSANELVDSLLKEADTEMAEFALITPKGESSSTPPASSSSALSEDSSNQAASGMPMLSPQMQNRLAAMQRDLNQLWQGLSSSLQNAVTNVKGMLNPRPGFGPMQGPPEADPQQNEINEKVKDLSKLQKEAEVVYDTVQQQQREAQQRQSFTDRLRGFVNNVDLSKLNHLPDQIGDQVNRFGTVLGNFWNTIPERWDNMMNKRFNQEDQARLREQVNARASTSSTTAASVAENSIM